MERKDVAVLVHDGSHQKFALNWRDVALLMLIDEVGSISVPDLNILIKNRTEYDAQTGVVSASVRDSVRLGFLDYDGRKDAPKRQVCYVVSEAGAAMVKVAEILMADKRFFAG